MSNAIRSDGDDFSGFPSVCAELLRTLANLTISPFNPNPVPITAIPARLQDRRILEACERRGLAMGVVWRPGERGKPYRKQDGALWMSDGAKPQWQVWRRRDGGSLVVCSDTPPPEWYNDAAEHACPNPTHVWLTPKGWVWVDEDGLGVSEPADGTAQSGTAATPAGAASQEFAPLSLVTTPGQGQQLADALNRLILQVEGGAKGYTAKGKQTAPGMLYGADLLQFVFNHFPWHRLTKTESEPLRIALDYYINGDYDDSRTARHSNITTVLKYTTAVVTEARRLLTALESQLVHTRASNTESGKPECSVDINRLEAHTPKLDMTDGKWIKNKLTAQLEGVETRTLADYRQDGVMNADKTFGRDRDGRVWRRQGTAGSHPWYLKATLKSQQAKATKS